MNDINVFYNSILNIKRDDNKTIKLIDSAVREEMNNLKHVTNNPAGFCRVIALNVSDWLKRFGIKNYIVDLNEYGIVDHEVLIAVYNDGSIKKVLIDPTFSQFVKKDNNVLIDMDNWPSDLIDKDILNDLINVGYTEINDDKWNNYLNAFGFSNKDSLDDYLNNERFKSRKG